jgi:uncharacterized membrane protein YbaN (DUF454 family)
VSEPRQPPKAVRLLLIAFGCLCVATGIVGIFIPGLPTTIFLIIALWAFTRSSPRLEGWLLGHPRLGPPLRAWRRHGAIPRRAKVLAVAMIATSWIVVALATDSLLLMIGAGIGLGLVVFFILTRPDSLPDGLE